jgi:hypothetical protein
MTAARSIRALLLSGLLACLAAPALAAIGTVQFAAGPVQLRDAAGNLRALKKGDPINEGEAIVTGALGSAQLKMIDGGILAIRPDTDLRLDTYRYAGRADGSESALMSLVKGGFRTITGFIGRVNRSRYTISTPTATIGIRGTDHEPFFIPPGTTRGGAGPGTYDKVNDGVAFIASAGAEQNIGKNQMGYAAPGRPPVLLPVLPELFKATPPVQKPAPGAPAEEAPAEAPPPPPPAQAPVPAPAPVAEIIQPISASATCVDSTGATAVCEADLTAQTLSSDGVVVPISPTAISTLTPLVDAASTYDHIVVAPVDTLGAGTFIEAPIAPQPAASYVADADGNVVSFASTETGTTVQFSGVARDSFISSDIRLGRWEGGSYTLTDAAGTQTVPLGAASAHWIFALQPPLSLVQRYTGYVDFNPIAWTSPTDALGNVGTLSGAMLTANFDTQTVNAGVDLSFSGRTFEAYVPGMPIGGNYFGGTGSVGCSGTGCDTSYVATLEGAFAGAAGTKATLAYDLSGDGADIVQGVVAFQAGATPQIGVANSAVLAASEAAAAANEIAAALSALGNSTEATKAQAAATQASAAASAVSAAVSSLFAATTTTGAQQALAGVDAAVVNAITVAVQTLATAQALFRGAEVPVAFAYFDGVFNESDSFRADSLAAAALSVVLEAGNLRSAAESAEFEIDQPDSISVTGGTPSGPTAANSAASTGISFGRWSGATVSGREWDGTFSGRTVLGDFHWIKGPELSPWYITQAVTGTFNYAFDGGAVTDHLGTPGSFNSASLTADFTRQAVDVSLDLTLPPRVGPYERRFVANADDITLYQDGFWASSNKLNVSLNGSSGYGNLSGQFTGAGANGAILSFALAGYDPLNSYQHEHATGAAAFVLPGGLGTGASYQLGLFGTGLTPNAALNELDEWTKYRLDIGVNAASRVSLGADGMPLAFDGSVTRLVTPCLECSPYVTDLPARFDASEASVLDGGIDAETGLRWGRYAGGSIAVLDRIDGALLETIELAAQNAHFALTGAASGPVVLPITGTANYTLIGHTSPTDNFGNLGTLGSAALAVDFANQRVSSSVNLSIAGKDWAASTIGSVPIYKGTAFFAEKGLSSGGNLEVTVNGSAANTAGNLGGVFAGSTGQAAAVGYSLHQAGSVPTTVTGINVFKRP